MEERVRREYIADGVVEEPAAEFQAWLTKVWSGGSCRTPLISLPLEIARAVGLKAGDWVVVAVRKARPDDFRRYAIIVRSYGFNKVRCPKCGRRGRVDVTSGRYVYIRHRDGRWCTLGRVDELWKRHPLIALIATTIAENRQRRHRRGERG